MTLCVSVSMCALCIFQVSVFLLQVCVLSECTLSRVKGGWPSHLSACLTVCLSVCLSVCLPTPTVYLPPHLPVCPACLPLFVHVRYTLFVHVRAFTTALFTTAFNELTMLNLSEYLSVGNPSSKPPPKGGVLFIQLD